MGVQALSLGVPVIAMDTGGVRVWAQEGVILVNRGDVSAMARSIAKLDSDSQEALRLGTRGQRFVQNRFDAVTFRSAWLKLCEQTEPVGS